MASWRCRPLELDTDGIWCCLPGSFPEEFAFKAADGSKTHKVNYPGLMLNVMCAEHNANPQYHTLDTHADGSKSYSVSSRMSIEFEVDGPYLVRPQAPLLHPDEAAPPASMWVWRFCTQVPCVPRLSGGVPE